MSGSFASTDSTDDLALSCAASIGEVNRSVTNDTFASSYTNLSKTGAVVFRNTATIHGVHASTPRFGHTNNITLAITGNAAQAQDYAMGLATAAIVMFVFFVLWLLAILIFKCLGYDVVGVLSGSWRPKISPEPSDLTRDNTDVEDMPDEEDWRCADSVEATEARSNSEEGEKRVRLIRNIRLVVIFSGLVIVAMAILMITGGIQSLQRSVADTRNGLTRGANLADAAVEIIDTYLVRQNTTLEAAQTVLDLYSNSNALCDEAKQLLCQNFDCSSIFDKVPSILDEKDQIVGQLLETRGDLVKMKAMLGDVNNTIGQYDWLFWVAAGAVILMAVCTLIMLNGVILAWQERLNGTCWQRTTSCLRGWLIVPIFVFLLIVGFVFSMVFIMGSTATADFCYDSPDDTVLALLYKNRDRFDGSILFPTLVYYVSGCPSDSVFQQMGDQLSGVALTYLRGAHQALSVLTPLSGVVDSICGGNTNQSGELQAALSVLQDQTCAIYNSVLDITDYFSCENFNGLYALVAYDAVCYSGNKGFVWIASTQFIILVFAMIMLTLRVAFYELVDDDSEQMGSSRCLSKCRGQEDEEE